MDDKTDKLIRDLAEKLGTTAEHLWGVLVRQAPISAWTDLIALFLALLGVFGFGFLIARGLRWEREYSGIKSEAGFGVVIISTVLAILCVIIVGINLVNLPMVMSGFFNPEYWAFKQIHP